MRSEVTLQHFILPGEGDRPLCLYAREEAPGVVGAGRLSFDTYFNAFSLLKWRRYTSLSSLFLRVRLRGRCICQLVELDASGRETELARRDCDFAGPGWLELPVEASAGACLVFCRFSFGREEDFAFLEGEFFTRDPAPPFVNIAAVYCTYHREPYLEKNLRAIAGAKAANALLQAHFQVLVVDNGSSLDPEKYAAAGVRLFPNINAGGSGGFARGMLEALTLPGTDYALLMDDDTELEPESLYRLLVFLSFLKPTYKDYFFGGTMFSLEHRELQRVWREQYTGGNTKARAFNLNLNMCLRKNVLLGARLCEVENQYNAWWMCCIPLRVIERIGLPLPFFVKWDDIEYGLRNQGRILQLNGICVWHEDFAHKTSAFNEFLTVKNTIVTALLTTPGLGRLFRSLPRLGGHFVLSALKLNYDELEAHNRGLAIVRQGPAHLRSLAPVTLAAEALRPGAGTRLEDAETYAALEERCLGHGRMSLGQALAVALTLNGHLLPPFLTRRKVVMRGLHAPRTLLAGEIALLNAKTRTATLLTRDRKRFFRLLGAWAWQWFLFFLACPRLMREYREAQASLVSPGFWRGYLGLDVGAAPAASGKRVSSPAGKPQATKEP